MKKLLVIPLLLACCLNLCSAATTDTATAPATTAAPAATTADIAMVQPAAPATLPEEYIVVKRPLETGGTSDYQWFSSAADVRKVKGLLPDFEGGKEVTQRLTGTPLKIRYVKGTTAYAYEIYPNDLIVWWYDMKCATVKGAYATVSTMLKNTPTPQNQARVEARAYGTGDPFLSYVFQTNPEAVKPYTHLIETMQPVEAINDPAPGGSVVVSFEVWRAGKPTSYYLYSYGYAEDMDGARYRVDRRDMTSILHQTGILGEKAATTYLEAEYWPTDVSFAKTHVFYPETQKENFPSAKYEGDPLSYQDAGMEKIMALLNEKVAMNRPDTVPGSTPLLLTGWEKGIPATRYTLYEDGTLHDTAANKWYTVSEELFSSLQALCK